jgi:hypothetical protein
MEIEAGFLYALMPNAAIPPRAFRCDALVLFGEVAATVERAFVTE